MPESEPVFVAEALRPQDMCGIYQSHKHFCIGKRTEGIRFNDGISLPVTIKHITLEAITN
jgi:hypothetical protein